MKRLLVPAIFFSVCTLVFGALCILEGKSLVGPILTGVSSILAWILFLVE